MSFFFFVVSVPIQQLLLFLSSVDQKTREEKAQVMWSGVEWGSFFLCPILILHTSMHFPLFDVPFSPSKTLLHFPEVALSVLLFFCILKESLDLNSIPILMSRLIKMKKCVKQLIK